jgi:hypothetical protein
MTEEKIKARDHRGRALRTPQQIARDVRAAELRSRSLTYQQIATELGLETAAGAYQAVQRGIPRDPDRRAAEARRIELAKLDTVEQAAWERRSGGSATADPERGRMVEMHQEHARRFRRGRDWSGR